MNQIFWAVAAVGLLINIWAFIAIILWLKYDRFLSFCSRHISGQASGKMSLYFSKISASLLYALVVLATVCVLDTFLFMALLFVIHP